MSERISDPMTIIYLFTHSIIRSFTLYYYEHNTSANRRNFIKETIATAAGLVVLPALAEPVLGAPALRTGQFNGE